MRLPILAMIFFVVLCVAIDSYIYKVIVKRTHKSSLRNIHIAVSATMLLAIVVAVCLPRRSGSDNVLLSIMWILYAVLSVYVPKLVFTIFDLIASIPELFRHKRYRWLTVTGTVLSVVIFIMMWWGALINRYRIDVNYVDIPIDNLPEQFDGYRIVQFSDLHSGTYGKDTTFVSSLVDRLNSLDGDMIVFTGDIVNRNSTEMRPFVKPLSRLKAPDGVYAILGNHDYGDYMNWDSEADKEANMQSLYDLYASTGIDLLRNSHRKINRGNDSIALIGVENIGDPPFKVYGSLADAYPDAGDNMTKILLSHNPAHWCDEIKDNDSINIALTLAGHTHAMQMMIGGVTPAAWRYATSHGLYSDSLNHNLYVNIGAGTVGIPTRIGATPEITVLTLRRK